MIRALKIGNNTRDPVIRKCGVMKRVPSFVFAILAFGFLSAMAWAQVTGQTEPPGAAAAEPASQRVASAPEKITLWEPLRSDKFETYEKVRADRKRLRRARRVGLRADAR